MTHQQWLEENTGDYLTKSQIGSLTKEELINRNKAIKYNKEYIKTISKKEQSINTLYLC